MADKLISQFEEGIPAGSDHVLYDPAGSGYYKKALVSNVGGGGSPDVTAPTVVSATATTATNVQVVFSESVTVTTAGWSFKKNGVAWTISSVSGSGTTWNFTMGSSAVGGDTLLRSYSSGSGNTLDGSSNELASFTDSAVTNSIGDVTAPTVSSATVENADPDTIVVVFSEAVTGVSASGWSFKKNGVAWTISTVTGSGTTWTFVMATAAASGDTLLRSYNSATGATVDGAANELASFTDSAVTNNVAGSYDPDALSGQFVYESANVVTSGSNVTSWTEKLGSGKLIPATDNPQYYATGGPNNLPYVELAGTSNLTQSGSGVAVTTTPADMFIVMRTPTLTADRLFLVANNAGWNGLQYVTPTTTKEAEVYSGITPFYLDNTRGAVPRTTWMLVRVKWTDEDSCSIEINNEPYRFGPFETNGVSSTAYAFTYFQLAYPGSQIAEIRLFNNVLSDTDANNLKSHLITKFSLSRPTKRIIVCGDSHTNGVQSGSVVGNPYMGLFLTNTGYTINRYAVNGSCAVNNNTTGDFVDFADSLLPYADSGYYVVINYGTNDAATASGGYGWTSWAQWKTDYKAKVQALITAGFSASKIILVTPPYSTGSYVAGNLNTVRTAINEIASELSTSSIDWYQLCVTAGLDCNTISGGDGIHADDPIHDLVYDALVAITGT